MLKISGCCLIQLSVYYSFVLLVVYFYTLFRVCWEVDIFQTLLFAFQHAVACNLLINPQTSSIRHLQSIKHFTTQIPPHFAWRPTVILPTRAWLPLYVISSFSMRTGTSGVIKVLYKVKEFITSEGIFRKVVGTAPSFRKRFTLFDNGSAMLLDRD